MDLVNFAARMKTCLPFILILFLLSQCNLPEPKDPVKERLPAVANLPSKASMPKKQDAHNFISVYQKQEQEDKVQIKRKEEKPKLSIRHFRLALTQLILSVFQNYRAFAGIKLILI